MDYVSANHFKKVIIPQGTPDTVYCVIYATDTSGNTNNTKNPFATHGGPYSGFVLEQILFNGTGSHDLDGNITTYSWDFGDGTKDNGSMSAQYLSL